MSNEHDIPTGPAPTSQPGPDVLAERTLTGIFVHLIGFLTSFIGPLLIYVVSDHDFTRENARNAMNWQFFYVTVLAGAILLFGGVFVADTVLPDVIVVALFLVVFALFLSVVLIGFLNFVFPLVATGKAIFGGTWEYPIAPDFFDLERSTFGVEFEWWKLIAVYVFTAPLLFGALLWSALGEEPDSGIWFGAFFATLLFVLVASLFALVLLYKDIEDVRSTEMSWKPNWMPYLGAPIGGGVATYLAAAYYIQSDNPSGDAVYGYMVVLWLVSVVFLYRRHRSLGTP